MTEKVTRTVQEIYFNARTEVSAAIRKTDSFEIYSGHHQLGSELSPHFFALVTDVSNQEDGLDTLLKKLFVGDLVIIAKAKEELQERIHIAIWQECVEKRDERKH